MDEASNATRAKTYGSCGTTTCDLTNTGTVVLDTTNVKEPTGSADLDPASDEWLACADGSCGGASKLDFPGSFTFCAWLRPDSVTGSYYIGKSSLGTNGYFLQRSSAGLQFWVNDGATYAHADAATVFNIDVWVHACGQYTTGSPGAIQLYTDGLSNGPPVAQNPAADTTADFRISNVGGIGAGSSGGALWGGNIDELTLWGIALPADLICYQAHCGLDGTLCMGDATTPANYRACSVDADCRVSGNTTALCDTTTGTCRGRTLTCTPSACSVAVP
jgi:hypothetical protein